MGRSSPYLLIRLAGREGQVSPSRLISRDKHQLINHDLAVPPSSFSSDLLRRQGPALSQSSDLKLIYILRELGSPRLVDTVRPVVILREESSIFRQNISGYTGISSQIRTKLRDWAVWQARAGCYSQAATSSNDSKTL